MFFCSYVYKTIGLYIYKTIGSYVIEITLNCSLY